MCDHEYTYIMTLPLASSMTPPALSAPSAPGVRPTADLLRALGDESRLRILALLRRGELCVCHIGDALALSQPNTSRHLGVLRHADLVEGERRGGWMYYRLLPQPPERARILDAVLDGLPGPEVEDRLADSQQAQVCR